MQVVKGGIKVHRAIDGFLVPGGIHNGLYMESTGVLSIGEVKNFVEDNGCVVPTLEQVVEARIATKKGAYEGNQLTSTVVGYFFERDQLFAAVSHMYNFFQKIIFDNLDKIEKMEASGKTCMGIKLPSKSNVVKDFLEYCRTNNRIVQVTKNLSGRIFTAVLPDQSLVYIPTPLSTTLLPHLHKEYGAFIISEGLPGEASTIGTITQQSRKSRMLGDDEVRPQDLDGKVLFTFAVLPDPFNMQHGGVHARGLAIDLAPFLGGSYCVRGYQPPGPITGN